MHAVVDLCIIKSKERFLNLLVLLSEHLPFMFFHMFALCCFSVPNLDCLHVVKMSFPHFAINLIIFDLFS